MAGRIFSPAAASGAGRHGAPRSDGGGDPAGSRGNHAGERDAGVRRVLPVTGRGSGTLTWLPSAGQVISQGQVLYKTGNGSPVVLLYGSVPDWRTLDEGITGAGRDPAQPRPGGPRLRRPRGYPRAGLGLLLVGDGVRGAAAEEHLGVSFPPGSLSLGQVVFEPEALRVSQVTGSLGGPASGPVLAATSDRHLVTIALDVSQQSEVKAGDTVSITLPDGTTTPGVVSSVGTVATTSGSGQGQSPTTTIPVQVSADRSGGGGNPEPGAGDGEHHHRKQPGPVLTVPVTRCWPSPGRVRRRGRRPGTTRSWVPVTPGMFDDAAGWCR